MIGRPGKCPRRYQASGGHVVAAGGVHARLELDDLVHQQERVAVGNDRLDRRPVERQRARLGHAETTSSAGSIARRMRARPRWAWHLTVPTGIPSTSAISS